MAARIRGLRDEDESGVPRRRAMQTRDLLAAAARRLAEAGVEQPRREARLLLALAAGGEAGWPLHAALDEAARQRFATALGRRLDREPLAYISGRRGFWTLDLAVSPASLIPRPDSETVVECLLDCVPGRDGRLRVLDLGTGTGCLLLAALSEFRLAWGLGVDRAAAACRLAASNARALGLEERCAFCCADWTRPLAVPAEDGFDVVLSNPPYIPSRDIALLMPEVARFEPRAALDGGDDGLEAYRLILPRLRRTLRRDGLAVLEVGAGQAAAVRRLGEAAGLMWTRSRDDLSGVTRALAFRLRQAV